MAASSSVVIKVKHGDTLRRFSAQIYDNHELNLTMDGLRNKIVSLFSFDPDTELILTYIDEDNDLVTLADDDDLRDVVKQDLKPLRITVEVGARKNGLHTRLKPLRPPHVLTYNGVPEILKTLPGPLYETLLKLSADLTSKASSSEHVQKSLNLNTGVCQTMKTVPEPLRENIEKISADLAAKAKLSVDQLTKNASLVPGTAKLVVDHFARVGMSFLDQLSQPQPGGNDSSSTGKGISKESEGLSKIKPAAENNEGKIQSVSGLNMEESSENSGQTHSEFASPGLDNKKVLLKKLVRTAPVENNAGKGTWPSVSFSNALFVANKSDNEAKLGSKPAAVGVSDSPDAGPVNTTMSVGFGGNKIPFMPPPIRGHSNLGTSYSGCNPTYECQFSGLGTRTGSTSSTLPASKVDSFRRGISHNDYTGNIFHRGIVCDGCGVHPITGPRFKSKVKVDYDLCSICFEDMGNETDYIRMDRPAVYRDMSLKRLHELRSRGPTFLQVHETFKVKPVEAKLDSCFIKDVNIFDGTVMAPLTPFTKIWRMRNNGTVSWPEKTKLVWIGGDKLSNELVVEIPTAGLMIDEEFEVGVDFISPELPGRYISHWRIALPSGQQFGQRVWVLLQVDSSLADDPPLENVRNLNLNLPPVSNIVPEIINVDLQPMAEDVSFGPTVPVKREDPVQQPNTEQELKFPINNSLLVGDGGSSPRSVSYPIVDHADVVVPAVPSMSPTGFYPVQGQTPYASAPQVVGAWKIVDELPVKMVEEKLLNELEEMGFREVDLNKKMLRMNGYDLVQAVDDLCGVAEWDLILEELQEMMSSFFTTKSGKKGWLFKLHEVPRTSKTFKSLKL